MLNFGCKWSHKKCGDFTKIMLQYRLTYISFRAIAFPFPKTKEKTKKNVLLFKKSSLSEAQTLKANVKRDTIKK